jgi:hypothetical protein
LGAAECVVGGGVEHMLRSEPFQSGAALRANICAFKVSHIVLALGALHILERNNDAKAAVFA